jgi:hypothetical protein
LLRSVRSLICFAPAVRCRLGSYRPVVSYLHRPDLTIRNA